MNDKPIVVGVILARGGSKEFPGKNIAMLHGKPVLAYTIEAALQSDVLDRVILTTDDPEIAKVGRQYGSEVPFMRPAYLAEDTSHTPPVIEHAVKFLEEQGQRVDAVVTLQPTSPLRKPEHICDGVQKFLASGADSLVSVCPSYPGWWLMQFEGDKLQTFIKHDVDYFNLERQQLPHKTYQINGALYVTKRELIAQGIIIAKNCSGIVMSEEDSLDIDTPFDLKMIEMTITQNKEKEMLERT